MLLGTIMCLSELDEKVLLTNDLNSLGNNMKQKYELVHSAFKMVTPVHQRFECSSLCVSTGGSGLPLNCFNGVWRGLYDRETYLGVSCHLNASIQELIKVLAELP